MVRNGLLAIILTAVLAGCAPPPPPAAETPRTRDGAGDPAELEPGDPSILARPFTAEQIRDEWVAGFTLVMVRTTPQGTQRERWTVVSADADGTDIEFAALDPAGDVIGEPRVERSLWTELRDHASFPAERAVRGEATRETPLGNLDGWLYVVDDPEAGTVTELFFARSLPGAPVHVRTRRGDDRVVEMIQVERRRPG